MKTKPTEPTQHNTTQHNPHCISRQSNERHLAAAFYPFCFHRLQYTPYTDKDWIYYTLYILFSDRKNKTVSYDGRKEWTKSQCVYFVTFKNDLTPHFLLNWSDPLPTHSLPLTYGWTQGLFLHNKKTNVCVLWRSFLARVTVWLDLSAVFGFIKCWKTLWWLNRC